MCSDVMCAGTADAAAFQMTREMRELLCAAVDALVEQHPELLTVSSWVPSTGFPLSKAEFAGLWLGDLVVSSRLVVERAELEGRAA